MAILKHMTSKNMDYSQILNYLLFQYDEETVTPIVDEQGRQLLREEYYIAGINCDPTFFDKECQQVNQHFHKNLNYNEIKHHHYVISFDPSDKTERGLTGERAQELGLEFAKKNFPGHQTLVVTHTDGHNHSSNIHVHIVINSVRKFTVEQEEFMERPCDSQAGFKHHLTNNLLRHLQKSLMEICEREHLHQTDLLSPSKEKVTQNEYRVKRKGQKKLDELNKEIIDDGLTPTNTVFKTQKQQLRDAIDDIAEKIHSFQEFQEQLLKKYQITVTDHRGRYSYQIPDRNKNITERALGTNYGKTYLEANFSRKRTTEMNLERPMKHYDPAYDYSADQIAVFYIKSNLRLVVNLQTCAKAQLNAAYARKVKISNLKEMAETVLYCQEHAKELDAYQESRRWLEANFPNQPLQTIAEIREKKIGLESRKEKLLKNYEYYRDYEKDLKTVTANVDAILDIRAKEKYNTRDREIL